jgi:hypothetical protein
MEFRKAKWDLLFIVVLTGFLLCLSHIEEMEILIQMPFITLYVAYMIGRLVGVNSVGKSKDDNDVSVG